jgi:chromate transporter
MASNEENPLRARPSHLQLCWAMVRLGLVSFGGNNALLMSRMVVEEQGWLSHTEMDDAVAVATLGPGGNSSNLSYEVGRRLGGVSAGLTSYASMTIPGIVLGLTVGETILTLSNRPLVAGAINGAEAAAVAMMIAIGVRLGQRSLNQRLDWILALVVFVVIGPLDGAILLAVPPAVAMGYLVRSLGWMP